jgi:hypothetical protein
VFQILPQHVLASGCNLQGVTGALQATRAMSVLWAYTANDPGPPEDGIHLLQHVGEKFGTH